MRLLHVGNIANNGYLNAKLGRRLGIEGDAVCDESHVISQPEWEEADVAGSFADAAALREAAERSGWTRPPWVLPLADPVRERRFPGQYRIRRAAGLPVGRPGLYTLYRRLRAEYEPLRAVLGSDLRFADVVAAHRSAWLSSLLVGDLGRLASG